VVAEVREVTIREFQKRMSFLLREIADTGLEVVIVRGKSRHAPVGPIVRVIPYTEPKMDFTEPE